MSNQNHATQMPFKKIDSFENREAERESYYQGDFASLTVIFTDTNKTINANLVDISVGGIKLASPMFTEEMVGSHIKIAFSGGGEMRTTGEIVHVSSGRFSGCDVNYAGIKILTKPNNIKRKKRFPAPPEFETLCYGHHPFRYNQSISYRVIQFAPRGLSMKTDKSTYLVLPGNILDMKIFMPGYDLFNVKLEITNINAAENGKYILGCSFVNPSPQFLTSIASYLLMNSTGVITLGELRENGFSVNSDITQVTHTRYVSTRKQWKSYLTLRLKAQQREGRWVNETDPMNTTDNYDKAARHIMLSIGSNIVAIGRVVFHDGILENAEHYTRVKIPDFIAKGQFVEVSRFATHPDYRNANLFAILLKNAARIALNNGADYILANCEDSLVPIYQRVGAKPLGLKFHTPFMEKKALNLMYFDLPNLCQAKGMNFVYWYHILRDLLPLAIENKNLKVSRTRRLLLSVYTVAARALTNIKQRKDDKKILEKYQKLSENLERSEITSENEDRKIFIVQPPPDINAV